ncbi:hypothetical protein DPMN_135939 [Dreissena polymorpha]|uniref:Uncharacterized protein n=1 Tax=Dreissena polymorpha TaxID=45954 RepID=A0A9D4FZ25_DREPO|nr:hypothetical protein DPMN_135939 [Dreissena polymorpha]
MLLYGQYDSLGCYIFAVLWSRRYAWLLHMSFPMVKAAHLIATNVLCYSLLHMCSAMVQSTHLIATHVLCYGPDDTHGCYICAVLRYRRHTWLLHMCCAKAVATHLVASHVLCYGPDDTLDCYTCALLWSRRHT